MCQSKATLPLCITTTISTWCLHTFSYKTLGIECIMYANVRRNVYVRKKIVLSCFLNEKSKQSKEAYENFPF